VHGTLPWQNTNQNPGSGRGLPLFFVAFCFGKSLPEFSAKVFLVSFFILGIFGSQHLSLNVGNIYPGWGLSEVLDSVNPEKGTRMCCNWEMETHYINPQLLGR